MKRSITLFAALSFAVAARAQPLNSRSFVFSGHCTGEDMVYSWQIDGGKPGTGHIPEPGKRGKAFIYPWLDESILIRGIEVIDTAPAGLASWLFGPTYFGLILIGNRYDGDPMLTVGPGQVRAANMYPADTGFSFPARADATPESYIDFHGTCSWPRKAQMFLTLYYSPKS